MDLLLISLGIPDAVRKIFEPFFTTKPVGKGTGQGRAMSRNVIVKRQGGKLLFKIALRNGTTFSIRLPLSDAGLNDEEAS